MSLMGRMGPFLLGLLVLIELMGPFLMGLFLMGLKGMVGLMGLMNHVVPPTKSFLLAPPHHASPQKSR